MQRVHGLVTEISHRRHRDQFDRFNDAHPGVTWARLQSDGSALVGESVVADDLDIEVAWLSSDLFFGDGGLGRFSELLEASTSLRWLQSAAAGVDLPLFGRLLGRGVRLCNAHVTAVPIAECVLRSVLDHFHGAADWRDAEADRRWAHHDFREVAGTTWLVIGLGAIGSEVARRAQAFDAHVIGVRRSPRGDEPVDQILTPDATLAALPTADVVVVSAPATAETESLVDAAFLASMAPDAVLVNVARGSLVDEEALLDALDGGTPEVAILDTFATEPLPPEHRFWSHPRVVVTPHSMGGGLGRWDRGAQLFLDNLARLRSGAELEHEVHALELPGQLSHTTDREAST